MIDPDIITTGEAAALKGVTLQTIRRAIQRGDLVGQRSGSRWLVSRKSLEAWTPVGHRPKKAKRPYRGAWMDPNPEEPA